MSTLTITREQFTTFEEIRKSGVTSMLAAATVSRLARCKYGITITRDDVIDIVRNYQSLEKAYGNG